VLGGSFGLVATALAIAVPPLDIAVLFALALPPSPRAKPPAAVADDDTAPEPLDVAVLFALALPPSPISKSVPEAKPPAAVADDDTAPEHTVAPHQTEDPRIKFPVRVRPDMGEVRYPLLGPINQGQCAIDLAEGPRNKRQIDHGGDTFVMCEAKGQVVVAAGLEQGERLLEVIPCLAILADEPASHPGGAIGDAGLGRLGRRRAVGERRREAERRRVVASI
jgi:hypothetical protein